ncbi:predicted protein [Enterococcus faecium Com15]|nr:predicted protein [Enterococcus faecium Com15]
MKIVEITHKFKISERYGSKKGLSSLNSDKPLLVCRNILLIVRIFYFLYPFLFLF